MSLGGAAILFKKEDYMRRLLRILRGTIPIKKLRYWICGECRTIILHSDKYCHCCGSKIRWDKIEESFLYR